MTFISPFRRVRSDNNDITGVQDSIVDVFKSIDNNLFLVGEVFEFTLISGSINQLNHRLQRKPLGYLILDQDAPAIIYRDPNYTDFLDKFLYLQTDMTVNIKIWIF